MDPDSYIFGNDIYDMIESFNIKELYIHKDLYKEFEKNLIEKKLEDNMNFQLYLIETINKNTLDPSTILIKDYKGMIGIKYY